MIKKYAVKSKKEYSLNGEKKSLWLSVGTIVQFDNDAMVLELNILPDKQFSCFPVVDKTE
jgi:hypothetical protein